MNPVLQVAYTIGVSYPIHITCNTRMLTIASSVSELIKEYLQLHLTQKAVHSMKMKITILGYSIRLKGFKNNTLKIN